MESSHFSLIVKHMPCSDNPEVNLDFSVMVVIMSTWFSEI